MKILLHNTDRGLIPVYGSDFDEKKKLKIGEDYEAEIRQPRNYLFLKKFFALMKLCYENQEQFNSQDDLRAYLTCKAGFYRRIATPKGEMILPKSIAFNKMEEREFHEFYQRILDVVCEFIGSDKQDVQSEIEDFM